MKSIPIKDTKQNYINPDEGYSLIELLIVLVVTAMLLSASVVYFSGNTKLHKAEEQGLRLVNLFREAKQRALNHQEVVRVEIDLSTNIARLIDENASGTSSDDKVIRTVTFYDTSQVRMDGKPSNISENPEAAQNSIVGFKQSEYLYSDSHLVSTLRFLPTGGIVNEGTNDLGTDATAVEATIYAWKPKTESESELTRAITINGSTGTIRFWEHANQNETDFWKELR